MPLPDIPDADTRSTRLLTATDNGLANTELHIGIFADRDADPVFARLCRDLGKTKGVTITPIIGTPQIDDAASRPDCILYACDTIGELETSAIQQTVTHFEPLPLMLIGEGVVEHETRLMRGGIEDCIDINTTPIPALMRATRRCVERSQQRVHINTAELRYNELFDNLPIAAFEVDRDGQIVIANKAFLRLMAVERKSLISDVELNGLLAGLSALQRMTQGDTPHYRDQHIFDSADGQQKHVVVSATSAIGDDGKPRMDVFVTDVTQEQEQTQRVVKAENRLRDLYDNVPTMMFELELDGVIHNPNVTMQTKLGLDASELEGRRLVDFAARDEDRDSLQSALAVAASGETDTDRPLHFSCAEGQVIECLLNATPSTNSTGQVVHAHAMLVDVTAQNKAKRERDALQEQLQLTQKLDSIGELAAGIAHEINTPAQYVSDNLSFLLESFGDLLPVLDVLPEKIEALKTVQGASVHVEGLAAAIEEADLDFLIEEIPSALKQGRDGIHKIREIVLALKDFSHPGNVEMEPSDLNRIIESTVTVARNEWKYVAEVNLQLDPALPAVTCYPSAISQVILNVVVNAAHAIGDARPPGSDDMGAITITSQRCGDDRVVVVIRDNGPGMPESVRQRVFDPFFTTKEVGRGTGQGLAISRRVVTEQHGGVISVETEQGHGTEFRIELPIEGTPKSEGLNEEAA